MIDKHGNKTNRTVLMENVLKCYFEKNIGVNLEHEVAVRSGIADFVGYIRDNDGELIEVIVIEIKQAASDFFSGHGLNFVGTSNYLAVPSELVGFCIEFLRIENLSHVGCIEVTDDGFVRIVTFPCLNKDNDYIKLKGIEQIFKPYHLRQLDKL